MNQPDSTAKKNLAKITVVKLSSWGLEVADFRKIAIAELQLRSNTSLKSCGIAIAEVLPPSCGIAIANSQKRLRVPTSGIYTACFVDEQVGVRAGHHNTDSTSSKATDGYR
jgi:hypothetical protein